MLPSAPFWYLLFTLLGLASIHSYWGSSFSAANIQSHFTASGCTVACQLWSRGMNHWCRDISQRSTLQAFSRGGGGHGAAAGCQFAGGTVSEEVQRFRGLSSSAPRISCRLVTVQQQRTHPASCLCPAAQESCLENLIDDGIAVSCRLAPILLFLIVHSLHRREVLHRWRRSKW